MEALLSRFSSLKSFVPEVLGFAIPTKHFNYNAIPAKHFNYKVHLNQRRENNKSKYFLNIRHLLLFQRSMSDATCTEDFPKPVVKNGRFEIPWKLENGERAVRPSIFKVAHGFFMDKDNNPKVPSAKVS